ncbi:hypothetical protein roselon_01800 [Roseibacterium elongatum DSM 19469]|uniref:Uncharacterized protein n=1 Tax=Roseicyclus elongatus DSM 19469 TaxID=1294273 RepID=W8S5Q4_9RHOB|nr:hypothetical protein [Roseibacterium elongatum]AHM04166.1 hypothetical protein roselon_01800 [Roseibacterium elongatum DSM 19469]
MAQERDDILAEITPQPLRRGLAVGMLGALGALVLNLAAQHPPQELGFLVFLVVFGLGALWLAWRMWQASAVTLELTREDLREAGPEGRILCRLDNVVRVERGLTAFKPANGFVVRLKSPMSRVYAPGLWVRSGRRLAVGGVTAGSQAKSTADLMNVLLVQRAQQGD